MEKKTKYITFSETVAPQHGKPTYVILNNKSQEPIGMIEFYPPWRQYVFSAYEEAVWNKDCLQEIVTFLGELKGKN